MLLEQNFANLSVFEQLIAIDFIFQSIMGMFIRKHLIRLARLKEERRKSSLLYLDVQILILPTF